jgi:hypothetical protein
MSLMPAITRTSVENLQPFALTGDAGEIVRAIEASSLPYYVYLLLRPNGQAFYVGKGIARRLLHHEAEACNTTLRSHKLNLIRAIHRSSGSVGYALAGFFEQEKEALACERRLILAIGRHDLGTGPLTNQTDGGEGASNPSAESRARRAATLGGAAADPDRRIANDFFHSIAIAGQQASVPIKPLGARRLEPTTPHPSPRRPQPRMAVALAAAALAQQTLLAPGVALSRVFDIEKRPYAIENGVAKDMLKAGMIHVERGTGGSEGERFVVTPAGFEAVVSLVGRDRLIDLGILDPI